MRACEQVTDPTRKEPPVRASGRRKKCPTTFFSIPPNAPAVAVSGGGEPRCFPIMGGRPASGAGRQPAERSPRRRKPPDIVQVPRQAVCAREKIERILPFGLSFRLTTTLCFAVFRCEIEAILPSRLFILTTGTVKAKSELAKGTGVWLQKCRVRRPTRVGQC